MKATGQTIIDGAINIWIWITVGLLTMLGFFGKRMLNRWDEIAKSHMPNTEIEKRIELIYKDMAKCQDGIYKQQDKILDSVSDLHGRFDNLYRDLANTKEKR